MGMDVYGKSPTTEVGAYFRKNVWGWHPLWNMCADLSPDIAGKVEYAHTNDGDGLCGHDARLLGRVLWDGLWDGRVDQWIANDGESVDTIYGAESIFFPDGRPENLYATDRQSVENFALFLRDCGGFEIC